MFSAEVRIARGEKAEAESDVLQELRNVAHDESMIELGLSILARLWAADQRIADAAARVDELSRALPHSPTVWIACAQAQRLLGHDAEAAQALFRALALAPQHPMARRLEAAWS
jgi:predicted Zn-dependent protease